jgi:hypothetical protein
MCEFALRNFHTNAKKHNYKLIVTLSIVADCCFPECRVCRVSFMLSVTKQAFKQSFIILNVVMLNVVAP